MAIHDCHGFHAFSAVGRPNLLAAILFGCKRCIDVALRFVNRPLLTKPIGQVRERRSVDFAVAPPLIALMHGFVVRVVLREHVPLRIGVQDPQQRVQHLAGRNRPAARAIIRNVFPRKMLTRDGRLTRFWDRF